MKGFTGTTRASWPSDLGRRGRPRAVRDGHARHDLLRRAVEVGLVLERGVQLADQPAVHLQKPAQHALWITPTSIIVTLQGAPG